MIPTTPNHPASLYDRLVATVTLFLLTLGSCVFNPRNFAPRRSLLEADEEQAGGSPPQPSQPESESPPRPSDDLGDLVDDGDGNVWDARLNLGPQSQDPSPPSAPASSSSQSSSASLPAAPSPSRRSGSSDSVPEPEPLRTLCNFHCSESPPASDSESEKNQNQCGPSPSGSWVEVSRDLHSSPAHLSGSLSLDSLDSEEEFNPASVPLPPSPPLFDPASVPLPPSPPPERELGESENDMDADDLDVLDAIPVAPPRHSFRLPDSLRGLFRSL